ncbi:hypothetical protein QPK87_23905 [Kamptonema cortianum]|nr:hypothetical protein [Oscillatoria laete-virens]MDK3159595.1 hypothetical protein [Kamptonema cortianum]MDL5048641.1 hypothetical protein [Oscillatoria amoena NRMC-F 0135]MDL5053267.1 hypothetical protein [Oscillatoria laete-virens NRMC-F 0139]
MIKHVLYTGIAAMLLTCGLSAKEIKLEDLTPVETGFGMAESTPEAWNLQKGEGIIDLGQFGGVQHHLWQGGTTKIIKEYPEGFSLPEDRRYQSQMEDAFVVAGDFKTGVGLWGKYTCAYHWLEYDIPEGATKFEGEFYLTDDSHGANFGIDSPNNHYFGVSILIDGQKVDDVIVNEMGVMPGSGRSIGNVSIEIPTGAKKIRFHLESIPIDRNENHEVVIHGGKFIVP